MKRLSRIMIREFRDGAELETIESSPLNPGATGGHDFEDLLDGGLLRVERRSMIHWLLWIGVVVA